MNYNSNCNKPENEKRCCYKIVHEICTYPSYYNEKDYDAKSDNFFNNAQNDFYGYELENQNFKQHRCNCNNDYNQECYNHKKENNCERKPNRCCCFKRWCW